MVSPSPSPTPRATPPPPLLIPVEGDDLDKEFDSFPDISSRPSSVSLAARHQPKPSLHLAPSAAPVTYQLSAQPAFAAPAPTERETFLTNAALRSTFIRQGTLQRLGTLRSGASASVLSAAFRPPAPIAVRQEGRGPPGTLARQPTLRFAAATTLVSMPSHRTAPSGPQTAIRASPSRLPCHVPIVQVADSCVYRGEREEDQRCQYGYEVLPVLSTLLEHQVTDVGANDGRACLHVVLKAPQKQSQQDDDTKRLLFYTKAPSEDDLQLLDSHSLVSVESKLLASFTPPALIVDSDTDDDNEGEFFYNEAQAADSSDDDDSGTSTRAKPSNRSSRHVSKPTSTRHSTSLPAATTTASPQPAAVAVPTLPTIPVQRPVCCICTSVDLIDPWLSACSHLCCGECWVAWLAEQSDTGDMTGGTCPECSRLIDLEGLKRVVLCDRCARLCVAGGGQRHWTHPPCRHTCCLQCWKGQLVDSHTCPVCSVPVDPSVFPADS